MLPINLNDLTCSHIQDLIDSEVAESLTLEYKQQPPSKESGDEKREFLYDIAAMANVAGGDMVFGIVECRTEDDKPTGLPERLLGTRYENAQEEMIRLASYIRDCIAPKLTGITIRCVSCKDGDALVVRVPSSWNKPHIVTMGGVDRFYKRAGAAKNRMSVEEIRRAFSEQGELRETIAQWRSHRAEMIEMGEGPAPLSCEVVMLFHVIPADSFTLGVFTEAWRVPKDEKKSVYVPNGNLYQRYNADGFLCLSGSAKIPSSDVYAYTQLFRSGIVEYAFSHFYRPPIGLNTPMIWGQELERQMVFCYEDAFSRFRRQGRTGSVYVGFSMIGIQGKNIFATLMAWIDRDKRIRQNTFHSPEVYVDLNEPEERPYERTLCPLADTLWQVDGREETPFRINGVWEPFKEYQ